MYTLSLDTVILLLEVSKEMTTYVKEAQRKAFKTVERITSKKNDCIKIESPSNLRRASFLLYISSMISSKA